MKQYVVSLAILLVSFAPTQAGELIPKIGESSTICLQSWMGTYVCAEGGGGAGVVVNREVVGGWEKFVMTRVDENHVTFRAFNGKYLAAENGGGSVVVANRENALGWERFEIQLQQNGLVSFKSHNGKYLCAESFGLLMANRDKAAEHEMFRITNAEQAASELTRIEINVYKLGGVAPFWHTGTVIEGKEFFFQSNNRVETCGPKGMQAEHHRTLVRFVSGNIDRVKQVRDQVIARWNNTRYDLGDHNCNFFTNDLLQSLGVPGLDQEYLNASGLGKGLRQVPGGSLAQELLVKWPVTDKRLDKAFLDDLKKLTRVPQNINEEAQRVGGTVSQAAKDAFDAIPKKPPVKIPGFKRP